MSWRIYIRKDPVALCTNIFLVNEKPNGERCFVKNAPLILQTFTEGEQIEPAFVIEDAFESSAGFLQGLVDELVALGYKANDLLAKDKELAATRAHLEDMRRIVFLREHVKQLSDLAPPEAQMVVKPEWLARQLNKEKEKP